MTQPQRERTFSLDSSIAGNIVSAGGQLHHNITNKFIENERILEQYSKLLAKHHAEIAEKEISFRKLQDDFKEAQERFEKVYEKYEQNKKRYSDLTNEVSLLSIKYPIPENEFKMILAERNQMREKLEFIEKYGLVPMTPYQSSTETLNSSDNSSPRESETKESLLC